MQAFRYDRNPMGSSSALSLRFSTFYPDANKVSDANNRLAQSTTHRQGATIAAYTYRHNRGLRYIYPDNDLSYTGNFLNMMFKMTDAKYTPNPALERALDVLSFCHTGPRTEWQHQRDARDWFKLRRSYSAMAARQRALRSSARRRQ